MKHLKLKSVAKVVAIAAIAFFAGVTTANTHIYTCTVDSVRDNAELNCSDSNGYYVALQRKTGCKVGDKFTMIYTDNFFTSADDDTIFRFDVTPHGNFFKLDA